jgi:hypothetical protein
VSAERHLRLVDVETGELVEDVPEYSEALVTLRKLDTQVRMLERDIAGKRLRIAELEADREEEARNHPLRSQVEVVHACWKAACGRRRALHYTDVFNIAAAIQKMGLDTCLRAVAGAKYDPYRRRLKNGNFKAYDDLETIFKTYAKVSDFAERAPTTWTPDPERIAAIARVEVRWVEQLLGDVRDQANSQRAA